MLDYLLGAALYSEITAEFKTNELTEVCVRANRAVVIKNGTERRTLRVAATKDDIQTILARATKNSLYAFQDEIKRGYVTFDGIRIGICGQAVTDGSRIITIKNTTSLNIRIPHEIFGCANALQRLLDSEKGVLLMSPPFCGKTTLIRDLARISSERADTLIIDERGEIYSENYRFGQYLDVMSDAPKSIVAEGILRAMAPEVVVCDELYFSRDVASLAELSSSGIKIIASAHIKDYKTAPEHIKKIIGEHFDYAVTLSNKPTMGSIKSIVKL